MTTAGSPRRVALGLGVLERLEGQLARPGPVTVAVEGRVELLLVIKVAQIGGTDVRRVFI